MSIKIIAYASLLNPFVFKIFIIITIKLLSGDRLTAPDLPAGINKDYESTGEDAYPRALF